MGAKWNTAKRLHFNSAEKFGLAVAREDLRYENWPKSPSRSRCLPFGETSNTFLMEQLFEYNSRDHDCWCKGREMRAPAWRVYSNGWTAFGGSMHVPGYLGKEADSSRRLCLTVNSDLSLVEEKLPHTLHSSMAWGLLTWTSEIPSALGLEFFKTNGNCNVGFLKKAENK